MNDLGRSNWWLRKPRAKKILLESYAVLAPKSNTICWGYKQPFALSCRWDFEEDIELSMLGVQHGSDIIFSQSINAIIPAGGSLHLGFGDNVVTLFRGSLSETILVKDLLA